MHSSSSVPTHEKQNQPSNGEPCPQKQTSFLHRSFFAIFLVLLYAFFAILDWTVIRFVSRHPIRVSYQWDVERNPRSYHHLYANTNRYYHAARVINAGVSGLTICLATDVCIRAAVTSSQRKRNGFALRKAVVLADRGWTTPHLWVKIVSGSRWQRYGSSFFCSRCFCISLASLSSQIWIAVLIRGKGFLIAPLQQLFLLQSTIKTPVQSIEMNGITILSKMARRKPTIQTNWQLLSATGPPAPILMTFKAKVCYSTIRAVVLHVDPQ